MEYAVEVIPPQAGEPVFEIREPGATASAGGVRRAAAGGRRSLMAEMLKKVLYVYRSPDGRLVRAVETDREFRVREAMDRLAGEGLRPQPGYDIARKLVYNWASEDGAVEAFIL